QDLYHQHHLIEGQRQEHQVCSQYQKETQGTQQTTELVRQRLEPQTVTQGVQQPWLSEQQLVVAGNGSDLAGELGTGSGCYMIMSPGARFEHDAIALAYDLHGNHDIVQQGISGNAPEQAPANGIYRPRRTYTGIYQRFALPDELLVAPVKPHS